jgi:hypothetical protein
MKISNDTIGNRTRDLPAISAVPQPTAPPYTSYTTQRDVQAKTYQNQHCDITRRRLVIGHRCFSAVCPSHLRGFEQFRKEPRNYKSSCSPDMRINAKTLPAKDPLLLLDFNQKSECTK